MIRFMTIDNDQTREDRIKSIQGAVAHMFRLAVEELKTDSGPRAVAVPRQIAMYLSKELTDASPAEIGRYFGGKHASIVRYSVARVQKLRRTDSPLDHAVSKLLASLACR
jgi:chromosomal replication initiator protein